MTAFNTNGKRGRDAAEDDTAQFPEQKKTFGTSLPFRTSPTIKHTRLFSQIKRNAPLPLFTQTITPTDSEDEISPQCPPNNVPTPDVSECSEKVIVKEMDQLDVEMALGSPQRRYTPRDLDLDSMMLSPKASPFTILPTEPSHLASSEATSGGRLPTPIYGHFQRNTDSKSIGNSEPPPQPNFDNDYEKHMQARRLPTPISEDEAMDTFDNQEEDMIESPVPQLRQPVRFPPPASSQSTKRNKPMFSMGFRADCEMCWNRVPGHYNHIFWA